MLPHSIGDSIKLVSLKSAISGHDFVKLDAVEVAFTVVLICPPYEGVILVQQYVEDVYDRFSRCDGDLAFLKQASGHCVTLLEKCCYGVDTIKMVLERAFDVYWIWTLSF